MNLELETLKSEFRIIVVLSSLYTGGAEFSTLSFYGWLIKKGYSVKLVCYKKAIPSYDPEQFGFGEVEYISGSSFLQRLKSLNTIIDAFKPLLVHSVLFEANLLTRFSRMTHGNFVHLESLVNEMYSSFRLADPNITRFKLEGYRLLDRITQRWGTDHFHANGNSVARHYQDKLGIDASRITVIPRGREQNAYSGDTVNRERVRLELQTGDRVMIMNAARHEFQKGQSVLLEAVNKLGDWKHKIQVVLVGREGRMTPFLREQIERYHLEGIVMLTGHRNDLSSLLAAADVFVFPSRFEGLPGAMIEAEAAGLLIVCSDIPNNREVAEENKNALFFTVDDSQALAGHLLELVSDEKKRGAMGKESLRIFNERFLIEEVHQRMESLIKQLIS